jgi:ADP-L-glycero-D-manno-heptose 6-epimerase
MRRGEINGLFNVGTGKAETFHSLGSALFAALSKKEQIEYIDMPAHLVGSYQYKTEAALSKLRSAGYTEDFYTLENAVADYVCYLNKNFEVY